ncbi:MAG: M28 family peptidase [Pseudomonadota bacterium]
MKTRTNRLWKCFFFANLVFMLFDAHKVTAAEKGQIWFRETDNDQCQTDIFGEFELGQGMRWQLFASNKTLGKELLKEEIYLQKGELLAFTEGTLPQPLGEKVRILQSKGNSMLIAGSIQSLEKLHTSATFFIKIIDPSRFTPQECGLVDPTHRTLEANGKTKENELTKRHPMPFAALKIDATFLVQSLREFSGDLPIAAGRIQERGSARGREAGQAYLKEEFSKLGLKVEEQCFSSGSYKGCNIIGILPGNTDQVLVVSAHADSEKNAGADDDGSGISGLLAIAKSMKSSPWNMTIHFVGFDLEEKGLLGSKAYVKEQVSLKTPLKANINLEMLGYDSDNDGAFHVIDCQRKESLNLVNLVKQSASERKSLKVSPYCTNRSDHASFWNAGIPAVVISQNFFGGDGNPCYHASCDKFDKVNTNYLYNLVDLAGSVVAKFSEEN